MLYWFGSRFAAPAWEDMKQGPAPELDMRCLHCDETFEPGEPGVWIDTIMADGLDRKPMHVECHLRSVVGGLRHLDGQCSCFGGTNESELTYREEAKIVTERLWGPNWMIDAVM